MNDEELNRAITDRDALPALFQTHKHDAQFWEQLGRAVASFDFLEDVLRKVIFAFIGTRRYPTDEAEATMKRWEALLERAMTAQLWTLATEYEKAVTEHPDKEAAVVRNVLCHGSWMMPDNERKSVPRFTRMDRKTSELTVFDTQIDVQYLSQVQAHVTDLICSVVVKVTHKGWQFLDGAGPDKAIWKKD